MQRPTSPHTRFFTSLKHLEKRLKLENHRSATSTLSPPPPPPPPPLLSPPTASQGIVNSTQQTDSLGTPMYLNCNHSSTANTTSCSNLQESEAPQEFLPKSPNFPPTHHSSPHENEAQFHENVDLAGERSDLDGDIEILMQLLNSSNQKAGVNCVGCDDGFYGKIVGVKGPKSAKEVERLERWIEHFLNGGKKKLEPFALAHLLLGKAAFVQSDDDCDGLGGFVFPSTIGEFLRNDPPID
ncbi:hypothetical protein ABFX02_13G086500 [Erythranthe guttata]